MKRRTAAVATAALLMASTLGLSACSNEIVAQSGEETQSAANLDLERISSVLGATGSAMTTADASLNAQDLSGRVSQGALAYRTAQYALATASGQAPQALDFTPASLAITNSAARDLQYLRLLHDGTACPAGVCAGLGALGLPADELRATARRHPADAAPRGHWLGLRDR
mgnify:CR=1 FL=1